MMCLQEFPDVIAQCVYTAIIHAYPNSWNNFDENFKLELCQYISLWQVGTKPMPNSWNNWEFHLLDPPNLPKIEKKTVEQSTPRGKIFTRPSVTFDLDTLLKEARGAAEKQKDSNFESSSQKKMSLLEVKRTLSSQQSKKQSLESGSSVVDVACSPSEEKRMGMAMEQLSSLEKSVAELTVNSQSTSSAWSQDMSNPEAERPVIGDPEVSRPVKEKPPVESVKKPEVAETDVVKPEAAGTSGQEPPLGKHQRSKLKGTHRHRFIKITNPEGEDIKSETSKQSSSRGTRTSTVTSTKPVETRPPQKTTSAQPKSIYSAQTSAPSTSKKTGQKQCKVKPTTSGQSKPATPTPIQSKFASTCQRYVRHASTTSSQLHPAIGSPASAGQKLSTSAKVKPINFNKKSGSRELKKILRERADRRESATLKGPAFERVMFNLYGHSPLVQHYMDNKNLTHENEKEIVVGRTEIVEEPPRDAVCYRDVLLESKATGDVNRNLFQRQVSLQHCAS